MYYYIHTDRSIFGSIDIHNYITYTGQCHDDTTFSKLLLVDAIPTFINIM